MGNPTKTISLDTAQKWTKVWRKKESNYNKHHECKAFLIPTQDLKGVLEELHEEKGQTYIRAYLGVEVDPNDTSKTTEKLIIVGTEKVTKDGKTYYRDLIPKSATSYKDLANPDPSIWDFSQPCPPKCDDISPLNGG
ncbi:hypothetical protein [Cochleicola gelatinilyticus]|uniref:Uncharacterized protein n=1 Tax=Cochleicola gelatinilyticus TaxID=1763537 RepID=A0A167HKQ7_9FLAO|nr:hypothetical protein [Cochleicola gelatinilyticus]OAB78714.1 hypothetical protein ULVI_09030 [Cochleicola gelatinilyticus]